MRQGRPVQLWLFSKAEVPTRKRLRSLARRLIRRMFSVAVYIPCWAGRPSGKDVAREYDDALIEAIDERRGSEI